MICKTFAKTILACVGLGMAAIAAIPASASPIRATWVWNTAPIRNDPEEQANFFDFLAAPYGAASNKIGIVYMDGISAAKFTDPQTSSGLRKLIANAHARKLRVDFLCGDPTWATPAGQPDGLSHLSAVLAFNRTAKANERFDGFQYDVEPYLLPGWPSVDIERGMIALLDKSNVLISKSAGPLLLSVAIPRWYGQTQYHYLDRSIIDRTDEVEVMDYVTTVDQLVNDPEDVLTYAAKTHKKVWIGVETGEVKEAPTCSFFGRSNTEMEAMLASAAPRLAQYPSFSGYAIHHYGSYREMKP